MNFSFVVLLAAIVPLSVLGRRKVVTVESFMSTLQEPEEIRIDAKSPITIGILAQISQQSDSIKGKNLWRVGIFGSEHDDGHGGRFGFKSQILKSNQASKRPIRGRLLKIRNILSRFDLSQIGCNEVRYFCIEFAKNSDATVNFEFRGGGKIINSIVSCREMECRRPNANAGISGGETLPQLLAHQPTARLYALGMRAKACTGSYSNISIDVTFFVHPFSDIIRGNGLWKLGVFLSNATNGTMIRSQYKPDILNEEQKAYPFIPRRISTLSLFTTLDTTGVGCPGSDLQYICVEFDKGEYPTPDFHFQSPPLINCVRFYCIRPLL